MRRGAGHFTKWVSYVLLGHAAWQPVSGQHWWSLCLLLYSALAQPGLHCGRQSEAHVHCKASVHCNNQAVIFSPSQAGKHFAWENTRTVRSNTMCTGSKGGAVQAWHFKQLGCVPRGNLTRHESSIVQVMVLHVTCLFVQKVEALMTLTTTALSHAPCTTAEAVQC